MSKRPSTDPLPAPQVEVLPPPAVQEVKLRAWFRKFLFCLLGAHMQRAERFTATFPFLTARLQDSWNGLVEQSHARTQRLVVEALGFAAHHLPPNSPILDTLTDELDIPQISAREPPPFLLVPGLGQRLSGVRAPLPICSLHDMAPAIHLAFAAAVADQVTGEPQDMVPWAEHAYSWLQNVLFQSLRSHQLCHVAFELVSEALRQENGHMVETIVTAAPDPFLLDVLVHHGLPHVLKHLRDNALRARLELLWDSQGAELQQVRPQLQLQLANAPLYPYQQAVLQWMLERERLPALQDKRFPGGIVACLPGMGKTRIAEMLCRTTPGVVTLGLVPLGVIDEWRDENQKAFGGALRIRVLHADYDANARNIMLKLAEWTQSGQVDLILTTVQTFVSQYGYNAAALQDVGRIIVDEVHLLSNAKGKMYRKLLAVVSKVPWKWGLTGTIFRNVRDDVRAQLTLLGLDKDTPVSPQLLHHVYQLEYGPDTVERPPRQVQDILVPLSPVEWDLYRQVFEYGKKLRQSGAEFMKVQAVVTRLRQCAISIDLVPPEVLEEMRQASLTSEPGGVFWGLYKTVVNKLVTWSNPLFDRNTPPGAEPRPLVLPYIESDRRLEEGYVSSKLAAVMKKMREVAANFPNDKMLLFCSYSTVLHKLHAMMRDEVPWQLGIYDGDVPPKERQALKRRFNDDPLLKVLMITYTAGGAGLNLQVATHVLEVDPVFNDATLQQAEARCWRVGQKRFVRMYRFLTPNTYEIRMEVIRATKAEDWEQMQQDADVPVREVMDLVFS